MYMAVHEGLPIKGYRERTFLKENKTKRMDREKHLHKVVL